MIRVSGSRLALFFHMHQAEDGHARLVGQIGERLERLADFLVYMGV